MDHLQSRQAAPPFQRRTLSFNFANFAANASAIAGSAKHLAAISMSALCQKRTFRTAIAMSALPPRAAHRRRLDYLRVRDLPLTRERLMKAAFEAG